MINRLIIIIAILTFASLCFADTDDEYQAKENAAIEATLIWLELIDEGEYKRSWDEAADYFKEIVEVDQWVGALETARAPHGDVISREIKSIDYTTSLPNAPDAEYFFIQFESSFDEKEQGFETLTPMLQENGEWRVSGYYIR